jgi:hypothetical protein
MNKKLCPACGWIYYLDYWQCVWCKHWLSLKHPPVTKVYRESLEEVNDIWRTFGWDKHSND